MLHTNFFNYMATTFSVMGMHLVLTPYQRIPQLRMWAFNSYNFSCHFIVILYLSSNKNFGLQQNPTTYSTSLLEWMVCSGIEVPTVNMWFVLRKYKCCNLIFLPKNEVPLILCPKSRFYFSFKNMLCITLSNFYFTCFY